MNQLQMIQLLNTLEIPSVYDHAEEGQSLPFIAIHTDQPDNFTADNMVYCEKCHFRLDLYSVNRDLKVEGDLKKLLNDNNIPWVRSETYLNDEKCFEVEFEFDIVGNDEEETSETVPVIEGGSNVE